MAALGFALFLICMAMTRTIGSELETWSGTTILDSIKSLKQSVLNLEKSFSSIPKMIQVAIEEMLLYILDKMADNSEALRNECQALLSNHSLRVEQLEDDVTQMKQNLRDQTFLIKKLHQQKDDETCPAPSSLFIRVHFKTDRWMTVSNISCSDEKNGHQVLFYRHLDTGTGGALPTAARTYIRGRVAVLDLSDVPDDDKQGVFQCGHGNRTKRTFMINRKGVLLRSDFASVGDTMHVGKAFGGNHSSLRWLHEGQNVSAWDGLEKVEIAGVGLEEAGVYEQYEQGDRRDTQNFFRLVVRGCPAEFFGKLCDQKCPNCYNGGLCDEKLGTCVCFPGFRGQSCEVACGRDRVGPDCSEACIGGDCFRQLFCNQDPYRCSCASGYWGHRGSRCSFRCKEGQFGADCKQTCRCKEGSCDPYTGACSGGCSEGWTGASCQIPVEN